MRTLGNFYLDLSDPKYGAINRIVRRALIVGVLAAASVGITGYAQMAPEYMIPFLTGLLAAVDKAIRENK